MDIAALILWILTAGGGFYLLVTWLAKGGARAQAGGEGSRFPPALIFGHFAVAATGLVLWIIYVVTEADVLVWISFILLVVVALLGFTMFARWLPTYRTHQTSARAPAATAGTTTAGAGNTAAVGPAERHFPVAVVAAHGLLGATTLVLVLLTALGVGGS